MVDLSELMKGKSDKEPATAGSKSTSAETCFFSPRPNMGIPVSSHKRVQFKGNYLKTDDKEVIDCLTENYSRSVKKISAAEYKKAHTIEEVVVKE